MADRIGKLESEFAALKILADFDQTARRRYEDTLVDMRDDLQRYRTEQMQYRTDVLMATARANLYDAQNRIADLIKIVEGLQNRIAVLEERALTIG